MFESNWSGIRFNTNTNTNTSERKRENRDEMMCLKATRLELNSIKTQIQMKILESEGEKIRVKLGV